MAGDPLYLPLLLSFGFDELSMTAASIPKVKKLLRRCDMKQVNEIADACLALSTAAEVEMCLNSAITSHLSDSFD